MQRILVNDAEIRNLAEPWLDDLDRLLTGKADHAALSGRRINVAGECHGFREFTPCTAG